MGADLIYQDRDTPPEFFRHLEWLPKEEAIDDYVTPGYESIIGSGGIVNNPCLLTSKSTSIVGEGWERHDLDNSTFWYRYDGPITYNYLVNRPPGTLVEPQEVYINEQKLIDDAKAYALTYIDAPAHEFGEDFGEIRETIQFLRSPLQSLANLSKSMRRAVFKHSRKNNTALAKSLADVWLSYRFAFRPLVQSAHEAVEALSTIHVRRSDRRTARGFSTNSVNHQWSDGFVQGGKTYEFNISVTLDVQVKASILYEVVNPLTGARWRYIAGLRGKDIPSTIWELFPLSFMVDRVVDIKTAIQGLLYLSDPSVRVLAGSAALRRTKVKTVRCTKKDIPGYSDVVSGETVLTQDFKYDRITWSPSVGDAVPPIHLGGLTDSATKIVDLLALIRARSSF